MCYWERVQNRGKTTPPTTGEQIGREREEPNQKNDRAREKVWHEISCHARMQTAEVYGGIESAKEQDNRQEKGGRGREEAREGSRCKVDRSTDTLNPAATAQSAAAAAKQQRTIHKQNASKSSNQTQTPSAGSGKNKRKGLSAAAIMIRKARERQGRTDNGSTNDASRECPRHSEAQQLVHQHSRHLS